MAPPARRVAREKALFKAYVRNNKGRQRRNLLRQRAAARVRRENRIPHENHDLALSSMSSGESLESDSDESSSGDSDSWSEILGADWRLAGDFLDDSISDVTGFTSEPSSEDDPMPDLHSVDSSSSSSSDWDWSGDSFSGAEGDDEETSDDDSEDDLLRPSFLRRFIIDEVRTMYETRYENPRNTLPRGPSHLRHVLTALKVGREDHFRQALRVSPQTFDTLVARLETDPIFFNNSNQPQLPVELQVAVALYRFGHDGNAASMQSVANWAGLGKGTVHLYTRRVMTAVLRPSFMQNAVRMPTAAEKEKAKRWVHTHSCKAWRNGWCFVDGTLVPLDERPTWYGPSYFDRKCNYSLNIQARCTPLCSCIHLTRFQVVNLPNLQIIDFSYGHTGSTHDSVAWNGTKTAQEHETVFEEGEWIWADSAYPVR
jgi:hypothetical protein